MAGITNVHDVSQRGLCFSKKTNLEKKKKWLLVPRVSLVAQSQLGLAGEKNPLDLALSAARRPDSMISDQVEFPSGFLCEKGWTQPQTIHHH